MKDNSIALSGLASGLDAGKTYACLGIDIVPVDGTPSGELVGINYYFDGEDSLALETLKPLFRTDKPLIVSRGQLVGVFKD